MLPCVLGPMTDNFTAIAEIRRVETQLNLLAHRTENAVLVCEQNRRDLESRGGGEEYYQQRYAVANIVNDSYLTILEQMGRKVHPSTDKEISRPLSILFDPDGQLGIVDWNKGINIYSEDYQLQQVLPVKNGNPVTNPNAINQSAGAAFSPDGTRIAVASFKKHVVRIFDTKTGLAIADIGEAGKGGGFDAGRLKNPRRVEWLDNDRVLVISLQGRGQGSTRGRGFVAVYDLSGKSAPECWLTFGESAVGKAFIDRPIDCDRDKADPNYLWILERKANRVVKLNLKTKLVDDIVHPPKGACFDNSWSVASLSDGLLAVASNSQGKILVIDLATRGLISAIDPAIVGAGQGFRDCKQISKGLIGFTDQTTKGLYAVPVFENLRIPYELDLPEGAEPEADLIMPGFNYQDKIFTRSLLGKVEVPPRIAVPFRISVGD